MAALAPAPSRPRDRLDRAVWLVLARRALRDARVRTVAFTYLFVALAFLQPVAYRHAYPTLAARLGFARSFGHNQALVLFDGKAYDLLTVGGYSAWRVGGPLAIFAAVFGLLGAVRALRTEEDAGRAELVLALAVGRGTAYAAALSAIGAGAVLLWVGLWAGLALGGLPAAGAAYLALAVVAVVPVFAGAGALTSQLAPTRRMALELGAVAIAACLVLRVVADTSSSLGWLRWLTPLGWSEELRPFTGGHPAPLLLFVAVSTLLLGVAWALSGGRDVGSGLLRAPERAESRLGLLSRPLTQALRTERATLGVWLASVAAFALIVGLLSGSISSAGLSAQLEQELAKLGAGSIVHPAGYIGLCFSFFALAICLFAVAQVAAARQEEASERLETLLALPVGRWRWLSGRLGLAATAAAAIALTAGLVAWLGAASQGVSMSLPRMLGAGANCLPVALLFLGLAALAYALAPRAGAAIAYGLVIAAFLWQLLGALLGAPHWLVALTPFDHIGLVPAQSFRAGAAAVMVAAGALTALAALLAFGRRDLASA